MLWQEYTFSTFTQQFILFLDILPFLILLNFASILIGILAWHMMLKHYSKKVFPFFESYYYFSKTEIAKYLPGNIFHFIGRQALASKIGISQIQMGKISLLLSFLLLTGTVLASTFFAFISKEIPTLILVFMGISSSFVLILSLYIYPTLPSSKKITMNLYLALSIAFQGLLLGLIIMYQSEHFSANLFFLCVSIYIVSWLIGFITPGASGGLGIREGTFIALISYLQVNITADIIIFSVLLVRLINIIVDIGLYLSTLLFEKKIKELKI